LRFKDKEYVETREVTSFGMKTLEKVTVIFRGVKRIMDGVITSAAFIGSYLKQLAAINIRYYGKRNKDDSK
jgi:hypothetical protein